MNQSIAEPAWLRIESIDLECQGVAHTPEGKVVFVEGALTGEEVQVQVHRKKNSWEQASVTAFRHTSFQRVEPKCLHYGVCGGCKLQHLDAASQVTIKQRALEDGLWHLAKVRPQQLMRPMAGPAWGYRYRARLSVRYVAKKGQVLVGFHEQKSSFVADMSRCEVLPAHVSDLLLPLRALIFGMDGRDRLPQIEVAVGTHITALVLRHLEPLTEADRARLRVFATQHRVQWWLQPKGPETAHLLDSTTEAELSYELPEFALTMPFSPTDFTQVNHHVNQALVSRALRCLAVQPTDRVIDWFCGLGNFTLPLATQAREVLGLEGSEALVQRATDNAARNHLHAKFATRNLFELTAGDLKGLGPAQKWLIDPPREGAFALAKAVVDIEAEGANSVAILPQRIVYVSCNPATLARDAGLLVHQAGYRCTSAGVINMFPHTAHVESMAVFDRVTEK